MCFRVNVLQLIWQETHYGGSSILKGLSETLSQSDIKVPYHVNTGTNATG